VLAGRSWLQASGRSEMVSVDPLTWWISRMIYVGMLHHNSTKKNEEQISMVI
jgi:hypothetical protein